jgi:outer membrane immunogenic protein
MIDAGEVGLWGSLLMRRFGIAAAVLIVAQGASAADLPILRGSYVEPISRSRPVWQGFYIGGHYGYSSHDFDFSKTTGALQTAILRDYAVFADIRVNPLLAGTANVRMSGFGGFAGYNWQWDDAVVGVEANYTHFGAKTGSSSIVQMTRAFVPAVGPTPPPGRTYDLTLRADAAARVNDLVTLRARGGYSMGGFMPYAFAGLAFGLIDIQRSTTLTQGDYDNGVRINTTTLENRSENQENLLTFGFNAGIGFEYLLMQNIFLRAEYEYVQLPLAKDTVIQLNTGRVGLGAKF